MLRWRVPSEVEMIHRTARSRTSGEALDSPSVNSANDRCEYFTLFDPRLAAANFSTISRLHASETPNSRARSPRDSPQRRISISQSIHIHIHVNGHHQPNQLRPVRSDAEPSLGGPLSHPSRCPCDASSFKYNTRWKLRRPHAQARQLDTHLDAQLHHSATRHPHSRISPCYPHHTLAS